ENDLLERIEGAKTPKELYERTQKVVKDAARARTYPALDYAASLLSMAIDDLSAVLQPDIEAGSYPYNRGLELVSEQIEQLRDRQEDRGDAMGNRWKIALENTRQMLLNARSAEGTRN